MSRTAWNRSLAWLAVWACLHAGPAAAQPAPEPDINLLCYGEGAKPSYESHHSYEWDDKDRKYKSKDTTTLETKKFNTSLSLQFTGSAGRIKVASEMIPLMNSGGTSDNWWNLDNVAITTDEIRASFALNGFNKPRVSINRHSGQIIVDGMTRFSGTCDAAGNTQRRF
jgi:hypothetical protein